MYMCKYLCLCVGIRICLGYQNSRHGGSNNRFASVLYNWLLESQTIQDQSLEESPKGLISLNCKFSPACLLFTLWWSPHPARINIWESILQNPSSTTNIQSKSIRKQIQSNSALNFLKVKIQIHKPTPVEPNMISTNALTASVPQTKRWSSHWTANYSSRKSHGLRIITFPMYLHPESESF